MAGRDANIAAKRGRQTGASPGIGDAAVARRLTAVRRDLGVAVVVAALYAAVAGWCRRDGDRLMRWVNNTRAVVRPRFTLAHERPRALRACRGVAVDACWSPRPMASRRSPRSAGSTPSA